MKGKPPFRFATWWVFRAGNSLKRDKRKGGPLPISRTAPVGFAGNVLTLGPAKGFLPALPVADPCSGALQLPDHRPRQPSPGAARGSAPEPRPMPPHTVAGLLAPPLHRFRSWRQRQSQ